VPGNFFAQPLHVLFYLLGSLLLPAVQLDLADKKPHSLAGCTASLTESVAVVQLHKTALCYTDVQERVTVYYKLQAADKFHYGRPME